MLENQPDYFRDGERAVLLLAVGHGGGIETVLRSSDDAAYADVDLDLVGMVAIGGRDIPRPRGSLPEEREGEGGSAWESRQRGCGWVTSLKNLFLNSSFSTALPPDGMVF
ncbi:hypothetical protein B0H13DRAFT_1850081 [Mycena leptocephala]|nr:hypothetical protein B0H13DRAFT_1850081 [Mycena leptocephala]